MQKQATIPFWTSVLMSLNIILGAGIYLSPQAMAKIAGSYSVWGWGVVATILLPVVWCFSYAARRFPEGGGFFTFGTKGLGQWAGFLAVWAYLIGYTGTICALASAVCQIAYSQSGLGIFQTHAFALSAGVVIFFALLNLLDMALIGKIQSWSAICKIAPLLMVIALMVLYAAPGGAAGSFVPFDVVHTVPLTIFAYLGIEVCSNIANLIEGGPSRAAQATFCAFGLAALLYTLFHAGLMRIMGVEGLVQHGAVGFPSYLGLSPAVTVVFQNAITFAIVFSAVNTLYGAMMMVVNGIYDMLNRQLLPGKQLLGATNAAGRPVVVIALLAAAAIGMLTVVSDTYVFMALTGLGLCTSFTVIVCAMIATAWRTPHAWLERLLTLLALGSCAVLLVFSWLKTGDNNAQRLACAAPAIVAFIVGFVLYLYKTTGCCQKD